MKLGENIKFLRKKRNKTLVELSKETDIDIASLSRIENDKMTGTIQSHMAIARALEVQLPELYEKAIAASESTNDDKAKSVYSHSGGSISELLTSAFLQKKMLPVRLTIKPKIQTSLEELPMGTERFVYSLHGSIDVIIKKTKNTVLQNEVFYFNASQPHYFKNTSAKSVTCLIVTSPTTL